MCDMTLAVPPSGAHVHPYATECMPGFVSLATQQQVLDGVDTQHAVTPATLPRLIAEKVPHATETRRGVVELATQQEVLDGVDAERAVTPATLPRLIAEKVPHATETQRGVVELATLEEALAGQDAERAVTPAVLMHMAVSGYASATFRNASATNIGAEVNQQITVDQMVVQAGDAADFDIVGGLPRSRRAGVYACVFTPTYINATGAFSSAIGPVDGSRAGAGFCYNGETRWDPVPTAICITRVGPDTVWRGAIYNSQSRQLGTNVSYTLVRLGD